MKQQVLLIEDDDALRASLAQTMDLAGLVPIPTSGFLQARRTIRRNFQGVILSDIRMPDQSGFDILAFAQGVDPELPVILLTGHSDVPTAMRAIKSGAYDYLEKPCGTDELIEALTRALGARALVLRSRAAERALERSDAAAVNFPGTSEATRAFTAALRQAAASPAHIHLYGPPGVGKRIAAYAVNQLAEEPRAMLRVNFGVAGEGAVAALSPPEGPADLSAKSIDQAAARDLSGLAALAQAGVRLITSSTRPLTHLSALWDELFTAEEVVEIRVPSLAERRADLPAIFEMLLRQTIRTLEGDMPDMPENLIADIVARDWPGNLPEMRAFASAYALGQTVGEAKAVTLADQMEAFERQVLTQALRRAGGKAAAAARVLGLPRNTFYDRLARFGISPKDFR